LSLLLIQLLAVESLELGLHLLDLLYRLLLEHLLLIDVQFLLIAGSSGRCGHLTGMQLLVIEGLPKVDLDVGLDHAYLVGWLAVHDVDQVVLPTVVNVDRVALHQARVIRQLILQDRLRVPQVNEGRLVRLQHHELPLLQLHIPEDDLGTLLQEEVVHHPYGKVAHTLFCREFEDSAVGFLTQLRVRDHEEHGVRNVQTGQLMQG
jgi:hypothetical protein